MYTNITLSKDVYTVKEVAKMIDCIPATVLKTIQAGTLRASKLSKIYIISREDLAEYLAYRERREHGRR